MRVLAEAFHDLWLHMKRAALFAILIVIFLTYAIIAKFMSAMCVEYNMTRIIDADKVNCEYTLYFKSS